MKHEQILWISMSESETSSDPWNCEAQSLEVLTGEVRTWAPVFAVFINAWHPVSVVNPYLRFQEEMKS